MFFLNIIILPYPCWQYQCYLPSLKCLNIGLKTKFRGKMTEKWGRKSGYGTKNTIVFWWNFSPCPLVPLVKPSRKVKQTQYGLRKGGNEAKVVKNISPIKSHEVSRVSDPDPYPDPHGSALIWVAGSGSVSGSALNQCGSETLIVRKSIFIKDRRQNAPQILSMKNLR